MTGSVSWEKGKNMQQGSQEKLEPWTLPFICRTLNTWATKAARSITITRLMFKFLSVKICHLKCEIFYLWCRHISSWAVWKMVWKGLCIAWIKSSWSSRSTNCSRKNLIHSLADEGRQHRGPPTKANNRWSSHTDKTEDERTYHTHYLRYSSLQYHIVNRQRRCI